MSPPVLQVQELGVTLDRNAVSSPILQGLSFDVAAGSCLGIVGPSGAGKSTLGLALMRLLPRGMRMTEGASVRLGERDLASLDRASLRSVWGRQLAMVFQEPITALNPAMRVGEQLAEAVLVHERVSRREAQERAVEMLSRVGIPSAAAAARRYPHEFSGGMRQRLLLAMPLMLDPLLIIADEPTTALDPVRQAQVLDLLDALRAKSGTAMLLITHDLDLVGERCDRVLVLDGGRIVEEGSPPDVLSRPRSEAARRLGSARLPLTPAVSRRAPAAAGGVPLLEVLDLHVTYPERRRGMRSMPSVPAVTSTSLTVRAGEVLGIVGESGCGKTSLALAILRLVPARSTAVRLDGTELTTLSEEPLRRMRRHMQFVPQDAGASLTSHLTCEELVSEGPIVHGLCSEEEALVRARSLLAELGLPAEFATRRPRQLSTGQRQRVAIARALAVEPRLLICDEPVSSVDPPTRVQLLDLLARLRDERGLALLFISHDVPAVARIADRIAVMRQGRIVEEGPAARVLLTPTHNYTRTLLGAVPTGAPRA